MSELPILKVAALWSGVIWVFGWSSTFPKNQKTYLLHAMLELLITSINQWRSQDDRVTRALCGHA